MEKGEEEIVVAAEHHVQVDKDGADGKDVVKKAGYDELTVQEEEKPVQAKESKGVATLDAFRALIIVIMILADDAGGAYGCTLADFVMPLYLFIVGVAIALALKVSENRWILSCS